MSQAARVSVTIDKQRQKELRRAITQLPREFRGKPILNAQKKLIRPVAKTAKQILSAQINSTTLDNRTHQVVEGKYAKKTTPYVVLQARDHAKTARRYRQKYSATLSTNFSKVDHLITQGTARGERKAGTSQRAARKGRRREVVLDAFGRPEIERKPTQGRYFLVQGPNGLHPIKQVKHPGTSPVAYYDNAWQSHQRRVRNQFYTYVAEQVTAYKKKKGIR